MRPWASEGPRENVLLDNGTQLDRGCVYPLFKELFGSRTDFSPVSCDVSFIVFSVGAKELIITLFDHILNVVLDLVLDDGTWLERVSQAAMNRSCIRGSDVSQLAEASAAEAVRVAQRAERSVELKRTGDAAVKLSCSFESLGGWECDGVFGLVRPYLGSVMDCHDESFASRHWNRVICIL